MVAGEAEESAAEHVPLLVRGGAGPGGVSVIVPGGVQEGGELTGQKKLDGGQGEADSVPSHRGQRHREQPRVIILKRAGEGLGVPEASDAGAGVAWHGREKTWNY